jgi:hypothetical protein
VTGDALDGEGTATRPPPLEHTLSRRRLLAAAASAGAGALAWWACPRDGSVPIAVPPDLDAATPLERVTQPSLAPPALRVDQRPATYLLQEAGERAFASLLARLDVQAGYRPYFALDVSGPQPLLRHAVWDWIDMAGRAVDGMARLRLLTGLTTGQAEEQAVRALLLGQQGSNGLLWNGPATANDGYGSNVVEIFSQSRGLLGLTTWYTLTGSGVVAAAIEAMVAGLDAIAVRERGTARYPGTQWRDGWLDYTNTAEGDPEGRAKWGLGALVALPLLEYHQRSGSRVARKLAEELLAYFADVSGLVQPSGEFHGHVHAEGYAGLATAAVYQARLADRDDRLLWADRVYRWIRAHSTRSGWFPDAMQLPEQHYWYWYQVPWLPPTCETCALADVLQLAVALATTGFPEYWDDVERFARNHLLASQFPDAAAFLPPAARDVPGARALVGSFASATLPGTLLGHLVTQSDPIVEGCCTGSGARALHLIWEHAVEDRAGALYVHLGFNTERKAAEVLSYEPYEGRREVRLRAPRRVLLRLPEHAPRDEAELWVDQERRDPTWRGNYADVGQLGPGQVVVLRYPLRASTERVEVNREALTVEWKGSTVLDVQPRGAAPVPYRRAHLARASTPWLPPNTYPTLAVRLSPLGS